MEEDFYLDLATNRRYPCFPPYGAGVLAANLKQRSYQVDILDLNYLLLNFASNARSQSKFAYDMWQQWLYERLDSFKPDIVGISCMFTMAHKMMESIARITKSTNPSLPVIAGGVHPTNAAEAVLRECPQIDLIGKFESDRSFPDLIDFINGKVSESEISQVATLVDGSYLEIKQRAIPNSSEMDVSPFYADLPIGRYSSIGQIGAYTFLIPSKKITTVLANRGCRAKCSFCSVRDFNGIGVRSRTVISVVDEIERHVSEGIRHFEWLDDDLFYDKRRTTVLFNEIVKRGLDITWDASNGVIAAAITDEIMSAAVESGCIGMHWGIESGSPEVLKSVHKPGTVETFMRAKEIVSKYPGVFTYGFLMIGFPGETLAQLLQTVKLAIDLNLDWYTIQILTVLPSTEIHRTMIERGFIEDGMMVSDLIKRQNNQLRYFNQAFVNMRLREEREKIIAKDLFNLVGRSDLGYVPGPEELRDCWFLIDYQINYERIFTLENGVRLKKIKAKLVDVVDRVTKDNPLGNLFIALIEYKMQNTGESKRRLKLAREYVSTSAYWRKRFDVLGLYGIVEGLENSLLVPTNLY